MNMKKGILLAVVIFLSTAVFAHAQEGELSGSIDVTYLSAYTWYGFDMYPGAHGPGAIQPSINLDLYGTGLGLNALWSRANESGYENREEVRLGLSYSSNCLEYETYATNYTIGWTYYDYVDNPSDLVDTQEIYVSLYWPDICPAGVVPSYTIVRMWKSESGHPSSMPQAGTNDISGWIHILGLGYDLSVEDLLPDFPEQILHLSAAFVWNEGAGAENVDHDYSHTVFGVSTDFDLGNNLALMPGAYYQLTSEESVNPDDDLVWVSVGLKYAF
jgi:hypothetical protein